jgi:hypothetical protein
VPVEADLQALLLRAGERHPDDHRSAPSPSPGSCSWG